MNVKLGLERLEDRVTPSADYASLYHTILYREPDSSGLLWWQRSGYSVSEAAGFFQTCQEKRRLDGTHSLAVSMPSPKPTVALPVAEVPTVPPIEFPAIPDPANVVRVEYAGFSWPIPAGQAANLEGWILASGLSFSEVP